MHLVKHKDHLARNNARILKSSGVCRPGRDVSPSAIRGILDNGYDEVYACAKQRSASITVKFELVVPTVSDSSFNVFLTIIDEILGPERSGRIQDAAGINPSPPPLPASKMARFVVFLFADLFRIHRVQDGHTYFNRQSPFCCPPSCEECTGVLCAIRQLPVSNVHLCGTIEVDGHTDRPNAKAVYLPVTSVVFEDGLTIPFAGYATKVRMSSDEHDPGIDIPSSFWK